MPAIECGEDEYVTFNPETHAAQCSIVQYQLLVLPESCPEGQAMDYDGNCAEVKGLKYTRNRLLLLPALIDSPPQFQLEKLLLAASC